MGTFAGSKLYMGTSAPINWATDTDALNGFEADTYVQIGGLSNMGEFGAAANVLTFPLVSDNYAKKSKGTRDAGDPAVVVERMATDPGQVALRAAEKTRFYYNFKLELSDAEDAGSTNTVIYFRAIVAGVPNQFGGNEDFVTETYNLGIYPGPLFVEGAPAGGGTAPDNTILPSITGTPESGETLTAAPGTWTGTPAPTFTYQWFADGESLAGQNGTTLPVVADYVGQDVSVLVTGTNATGSKSAMSAVVTVTA